MDTPHIVTPTPAELHTFSTNMVAPLKDCVIHFDPVQEGEGDPSPENVRNITGWTGLQLHKGGKNLFNLSWYTEAGWEFMPDIELPDTYQGNKQRFYFRNGGNASSVPSARGLFGKLIQLGQVRVSFYKHYDSSDRVLFHYVGASAWSNHTGNIVSPGEKSCVSDPERICDGVALGTVQGSAATGRFSQFQIEIGDEQTEYSTPSTMIPVDWTDTAGMLYGGTYNPVTGELVAEDWCIDLGAGNWVAHSSLPNVFQRNRNSAEPAWRRVGSGQVVAAICNRYKLTSSRATDIGEIDNGIACGTGASDTMYVHDSSCADADAFNTAIQGAKLVYKLATPIVYHLPPLNLKTLKGINNIWSNANGNIDLSYWTH